MFSIKTYHMKKIERGSPHASGVRSRMRYCTRPSQGAEVRMTSYRTESDAGGRSSPGRGHPHSRLPNGANTGSVVKLSLPP